MAIWSSSRRGARPNTVLATAYDLKVFFEVVGKEPARVSTADVFAFIAAQRAPRRGCRCGAARGRRGWAVGAHDQATIGERVRAVRVPAGA